MKKVALVFVIAVIAPSLVLAWLALRSLRDQTYVVDRQQTLLYQNLVDATAQKVSRQLLDVQRAFAAHVEMLLKGSTPRSASPSFDAKLRQSWPLAELGFVVDLDGQIIEPSLFAGAQARQFRIENDRFLCRGEAVEVYWNSPKGPISLAKLDQKEEAIKAQATPAKAFELTAASSELNPKSVKPVRTVTPSKETPADTGSSKIAAEETNFRNLIGDSADGTFARFLQDKLHVMLWHRASGDSRLLFGAQLNLAQLVNELRDLIQGGVSVDNNVCLALLDDTGKPVVLSRPEFRPTRKAVSFGNHLVSADSRIGWKRPFVASEVGEALPHWEVAVYLVDPSKVVRSAGTLRMTLGLLVALLLVAIAVGSWLIVTDLQRQLALARQKTDFVSNVSHELKTPLTSIRMFSEMLAENRVDDDAKRRHFLGIITAETARLTRLINNVLDFARMERGEKKYQFARCDLAGLVRDTVESYRPHLEAGGFALHVRLPSQPIEVHGDRDALAQVLVNLLSNAEKYSSERKEIEVEVESRADEVTVQVLDRGTGVPSGCEQRIFEQFYRAHDSLASGIQGSGLGLTLARQIARGHGGDVTYTVREGGGSCFVLRLPVTGRT
jgi:signal transduction histidine kinase